MLLFCTNVLCVLMIGVGEGDSVMSDPQCGYRAGNALTALCKLHRTAV